MHAERLSNRALPSSSSNPTQALANNTYNDRDARRAARKNLVCSNTQCGASVKKGHTFPDCSWPGEVKRAVNFRREEVLASPESLMAWNEAADATVPVSMPNGVAAEMSSNAYLVPDSSDSFNIIDSAATSEFELVDEVETDDDVPGLEPVDPNHHLPHFLEACGAVQTSLEVSLQHGQLYPGDDHIQEEQRFVVYQTSATKHVIMDNMINEDVLVPTPLILTPAFDISAWYAAHRQRVLGLP
ncbi:hypothetical protein C8J57DRAFT_1234783 [Mycena rebaudengoi]|nr:hypothetical protein C8J57DRAFT_1234783 [Mycena rebaudengoi]